MKGLRVLYHIVRADFYERFRRYNVLIIIGLTIFLTTLYLPPQGVGRLSFNVGGYRGNGSHSYLHVPARFLPR